MAKYRLVSKVVNTPSEHGAGFLKYVSASPYILVSIAVVDGAVPQYIGHDMLLTPGGAAPTAEQLALNIATHQLFTDDSADAVNRNIALSSGFVDVAPTQNELHFKGNCAVVTVIETV